MECVVPTVNPDTSMEGSSRDQKSSSSHEKREKSDDTVNDLKQSNSPPQATNAEREQIMKQEQNSVSDVDEEFWSSDDEEFDETFENDEDEGWIVGETAYEIEQRVRARWKTAQWSDLQNYYFVRTQARLIIKDLPKNI
eukprot:TRINITY_DN4642_c0_g1_i1.p1 TRINITY_DN4642_c0_g1~~TRINITY_DN4642_c0_g1_i1.p1  ORF type:complete len:139 (+),score=40.72 TRINITY_DN4642_c0_g1_i1:1238-1654(+)